jgi:pilus assembly protein CpaE
MSAVTLYGRNQSDPRPVAALAPTDRPAASGAAGRVHAYFGAKGGVGTSTLAINTAISLHIDQGKSVVLVDANLNFGDHRSFLGLGDDERSIVDAVAPAGIDQQIVRKVIVRHKSGVDLVLAPSTPEGAEYVKSATHDLLQVCMQLRAMYDYVVVDLDKQLDDHTLDVIALADKLFMVMTLDLASIKNVRLLLDTISDIGVPDERVQLVLNRSNAWTGISAKAAERAIKRPICHQVVNDYRTALTSLNSREPFMLTRRDSPLGKAVRAFAAAIGEPRTAAAAPLHAGKLAPAFG